MKKFAIIGVAGYVAPRHLKAIYETGHQLVAAMDKSDSVGILDQYFPDAAFFTEYERFERHLVKLKNSNQGIDYLVVCSPNYLHDTHVRLGLNLGADVICEKPLVLNPHNIEVLKQEEILTHQKVYTILQLRLQPVLQKLKKQLEGSTTHHQVSLNYVTPRGKWYQYSWKGDEKKSGGLATNIGIHLFDLLIWLFGKVISSEIKFKSSKKMSGVMQLERASVDWSLSIEAKDLPPTASKSYRSILVDGQKIEFDNGFQDLHTESYKEILNGNGFTIEEVRPSIELVSSWR